MALEHTGEVRLSRRSGVFGGGSGEEKTNKEKGGNVINKY